MKRHRAGIPFEKRADLIITDGNGLPALRHAAWLYSLLPTAFVNVLNNLGIEPSEGHHRHTAVSFLAIPHEVLALKARLHELLEAA